MAEPIITVFGGTGFLGRAIVRALASQGYTVRVAARRPEALSLPGSEQRLQPRRVDIGDASAVADALSGATAAVNAVSLYVEGRGTTFDDIHVKGAHTIATAAHAAGVNRLVHISGIGADAESPSTYVAARGRGEQAVAQAFPSATLIRPSVLFGENDAFLSTLDAVTRLPIVPLFGDGSTRLQPVHVADVAAAVAAVIQGRGDAHRVYELGGAAVYRYREVLSLVLQHRRRRRLLLPVPFALWHLLARTAAVLPSPPLTRDQVILMQQDNVVNPDRASFPALGIVPSGLQESLAQCLP